MSQRIRKGLSHATVPIAGLCMWASLGLSTATPANGWGAGGHMMVATIAFDRLNPNARSQVQTLLAVPINPCDVSKRSADFVNAGHWADDVRPDVGFDFAPDFHFADFPIAADETPLPTDLPKEHNVLVALEHYVGVLKTSFDTNERAEALRFVIHFVGDIHQPLHCATLVDALHPHGDQGGNLFQIMVGGKSVKLHSYWDGGLGSFPPSGAPPGFRPPRLRSIPPAVELVLRGHPDSDPDLRLDQPFDFQRWAAESRELAGTAAYDGIARGQAPTADYQTRGLEIVRKRVAFAGYRLAALLNAIWPAPPQPSP